MMRQAQEFEPAPTSLGSSSIGLMSRALEMAMAVMLIPDTITDNCSI